MVSWRQLTEQLVNLEYNVALVTNENAGKPTMEHTKI